MAARPPKWQKYVRMGGFLLVFMLFAPGLFIFLVKTLAFFPKRVNGLSHMTPVPMPMMDQRADTATVGRMMNAPAAVNRVARPMPPQTTIVSLSSGQKIAKGATLDLRAQSLKWTTDKIQEIVKNVGGSIENVHIAQPLTGVKTAWLSVRVPTDRLDVTLEEVKRAASAVVSENAYAGDVTEQSIDLTARLNTKRAEETALMSLLERATGVNDVIQVTERLSMVRSDIERMEAEDRLLVGQIAMASLTISITEDPRVVVDTNAVRDGNAVKQSITDISRFGIAVGSALLALLISGVPVLVIYGFFIWVAYRFARVVANRVVRRK